MTQCKELNANVPQSLHTEILNLLISNNIILSTGLCYYEIFEQLYSKLDNLIGYFERVKHESLNFIIHTATQT